MKKSVVFLLTLLVIIFLGVLIFVIVSQGTRYEKIIEHDGPLILKGDEKLVIENIHYIQRGDVLLKDKAELIIKNSLFEWPNEYSGQWKFGAYEQSQFLMQGSRFRVNQWLSFSFFDQSRAVYKNNQKALGSGGDFGPWHLFVGESTLELEKSYFGGTIGEEAQWFIKDSPSLFLELGITGENQIRPAKADEVGLVRNRTVARWEFPNNGEEGILYKLVIENSNIDKWGVFIPANGSLILRDSEEVNICFPIFGSSYQNEVVRFSGLKAKHYSRFAVEFLDAKLDLINTSVSGWCASTWDNNTIHIIDSNLDDIANFVGQSKGVYERVTARVVIANEGVEFIIRDSEIEGDVTAKDGSKITLINTKIGGKVTEEGAGKVIIKP